MTRAKLVVEAAKKSRGRGSEKIQVFVNNKLVGTVRPKDSSELFYVPTSLLVVQLKRGSKATEQLWIEDVTEFAVVIFEAKRFGGIEARLAIRG